MGDVAFKIDNMLLNYMPHHIQVIEPEPQVYPGPGLGKVVVQPMTPGRIELRWGLQSAADRAAIAELRAARGMDMVHMLSWDDETESGRLYHRNVVIPLIGYGQGFRESVDTFTLALEEIRPMPSLAVVEFHVPGPAALATGDGKAKWKAPAGGKILKVDGSIGTLGTGAGQTRVQLRNGTDATDYLSTRGDFVVASNTRLMENQVLIASPTFNRNEVINLDIDSVPAGNDAAYLHVLVYALLFTI